MAETQQGKGRAGAADDKAKAAEAAEGDKAKAAATPAEDDQAKGAPERETARKAGSDAAPIEPRNGDPRPRPEGERHLSTSPVAAAAGQRSLVGQGHLGLVGDDGSDVDADSIFDFDADPDKTYVVVKSRVHEKFVQAGSSTAITRLLFPEGARIPRDRARAFVDAVNAEAENPLTEAPGRERLADIPGTTKAAEAEAARAEREKQDA